MSAGLERARSVQAELDALLALGVLSPREVSRLRPRYPTTPWDVAALTRIFTLLGVVMAAAGLVILVREWINWRLVGEFALGWGGAGLLLVGHLLKHRRSMPHTGEALELGGAISLQGLVWDLAIRFSTGSGDWPAVVGVNVVLGLVLAYGLVNRLVLWLALANLFVYLGGRTGYVSGWGAYWLGLTYPLRYLAFAILMIVWAAVHSLGIRGRWAPFGRVWLHFGLLCANLSLWFLALFGIFTEHDIRWKGTEGERVVFSVVWHAVSVACMVAGGRIGLKLLRGWGMTFLILGLYTSYFQFVAVHSGSLWFLHLLLVGGSLFALSTRLERLRAGAQESHPPPSPTEKREGNGMAAPASQEPRSGED
ncbi:MAG: hypothetical protein H6686_00260 [Fibrobacteria bacterium]|nr:hypothetical protein [Fibrobacteria bacterium]